MEHHPKNNPDIIGRIKKVTVISLLALVGFVFIFTKNIIYCIITLWASTIALLGFSIMIKLIDKYFKTGKGKALFFLFMFSKLALISAIFYPVSRISEEAILFYILGLSVIVISTITEGIYQIYRSFTHGT